jgi:anti-sigma factor RsiW
MRRFGRRRDPDALTCHEAAKILQAYLDGELDDIGARRVSAHLEVCRRCGLDLEVYTVIKAALRRRTVGDDDLAVRRLRSFADDLAAGRIVAAGWPRDPDA